jgi:hypothetical protein
MNSMVKGKYGVLESNGIDSVPEHIRNAERTEYVSITDPDLARVDRLRLVSDFDTPWWDISYCWGTMKDGTAVRVDMEGIEITRGKGKSITRQVVEHCKELGVYAKGLGLLDPSTISALL